MLCSEEVNSLFHRVYKTSILCRSDKNLCGTHASHTLGFFLPKISLSYLQFVLHVFILKDRVGGFLNLVVDNKLHQRLFNQRVNRKS